MELNLNGKVAFIAGGSRGIGAEIARTLVREGMRVFIAARGEEDLKNLSAELGQSASTFVADLTHENEVISALEACASKWGGVDSLICNVGSGRSVTWGQEDAAEWIRVLNLNLISSALTVKHATPYLEKSSGSVVCISSICGERALGAPVAYSSAKAALNQFVSESVQPLSALGVRINLIAPGNILFSGGSWEKKMKAEPKKIADYISDTVPMKRFGQTTEIADACAFLLSNRSAFTTGSTLRVDGGQAR